VHVVSYIAIGIVSVVGCRKRNNHYRALIVFWWMPA